MAMVRHTHLLAPGDHPSPHRERVALAVLFVGVMAAPLAWIAQLVINYALASHNCFPGSRPVIESARSDGVWTAVLIVNLIAILLALGSMGISLQNWRASHAERPGDHAHLIDAGEGRTRFLALWGTVGGIGFLIAILFDTLTLFMVPQCVG